MSSRQSPAVPMRKRDPHSDEEGGSTTDTSAVDVIADDFKEVPPMATPRTPAASPRAAPPAPVTVLHKEKRRYPMVDMSLNIAFLFVVWVLTNNLTSAQFPMYYNALVSRSGVAAAVGTINGPDAYYAWLKTTLLPVLAQVGDNVDVNGGHQISSFDRQLGVLRLLQTRSKAAVCNHIPNIDDIACDQEQGYYEVLGYDKESFGPNAMFSYTYNANTPKFCGPYACYPGDGFVQEIDTANATAAGMAIDALMAAGFIDSRTRGIATEFVTYNPSLNLFGLVRVIVEFPVTGAALVASDVHSARFLHYVTAWDWFILAMELIFIGVILYNLVWLLAEIHKHGLRKAFRKVRIWSVTVQEALAIFLIILRIAEGGLVAAQLPASTSVFPELWMANKILQTEEIVWGLLCMVSWLRQIDYARYMKTTALYARILVAMFWAFMPFTILLTIIFVGFAHMGYMWFYRAGPGFSTLINSLFQLFRTLTTADNGILPLFAGYPLLASLFFLVFMMAMWLFVMNLLITILNGVHGDIIDDDFKETAKREAAEANMFGDALGEFGDALSHSMFGNDPPPPPGGGAAASIGKLREEVQKQNVVITEAITDHMDSQIDKLTLIERRVETVVRDGSGNQALLNRLLDQIERLNSRLAQHGERDEQRTARMREQDERMHQHVSERRRAEEEAATAKAQLKALQAQLSDRSKVDRSVLEQTVQTVRAELNESREVMRQKDTEILARAAAMRSEETATYTAMQTALMARVDIIQASEKEKEAEIQALKVQHATLQTTHEQVKAEAAQRSDALQVASAERTRLEAELARATTQLLAAQDSTRDKEKELLRLETISKAREAEVLAASQASTAAMSTRERELTSMLSDVRYQLATLEQKCAGLTQEKAALQKDKAEQEEQMRQQRSSSERMLKAKEEEMTSKEAAAKQHEQQAVRTAETALNARIDAMIATERANQATIQDLKVQLAQSEQQASRFRDEKTAQAASLDSLAREKAAVEGQLKAATEQLHKTRVELVEKQKEFAEKEAQIRAREVETLTQSRTREAEAHATHRDTFSTREKEKDATIASLKQQLTVLEQMLDTLQREKAATQRERETLDASLTALRGDLVQAQLRTKERDAAATIDLANAKSRETEALANQQAQHTTRVESLVAAERQREALIQDLRVKLTAAESAVSTSRQEKESLDKAKTALEATITALKQRSADLEEQVRAKEMDVRLKEAGFKAHKDEAVTVAQAELAQRLQATTAEKQGLEDQLNRLRIELRVAQTENEHLRKENQEKTARLERERAEAERKHEALIASLREQTARLDLIEERTARERTALEELLKAAEREVQNLNREKLSVEQALATRGAELKAAEDKIKFCEEVMETYRTDAVIFQAQMNIRQASLDSAQQRLQELEKALISNRELERKERQLAVEKELLLHDDQFVTVKPNLATLASGAMALKRQQSASSGVAAAGAGAGAESPAAKK